MQAEAPTRVSCRPKRSTMITLSLAASATASEHNGPAPEENELRLPTSLAPVACFPMWVCAKSPGPAKDTRVTASYECSTAAVFPPSSSPSQAKDSRAVLLRRWMPAPLEACQSSESCHNCRGLGLDFLLPRSTTSTWPMKPPALPISASRPDPRISSTSPAPQRSKALWLLLPFHHLISHRLRHDARACIRKQRLQWNKRSERILAAGLLWATAAPGATRRSRQAPESESSIFGGART